jgi:hypothetical protein
MKKNRDIPDHKSQSPDSFSQGGKFSAHLIGLFFLACAVFIAYFDSLDGIWVFDDFQANMPFSIGLIKDLSRISPQGKSLISPSC